MLLIIGNILYVLIALAMTVLILLQRGAGADAGSGFGGGASATVFGARGSANFLSRSTAICATLFFVCTLGLAYFGSHRDAAVSQDSLLERAAPASAPAPAAAASGAAAIPEAPVAAQPAASAASK